MKLADFLTAEGAGSLTKLAQRLKVSRGFLSDVAAGKKDVSMSMARLIRIATRGEVTPNDLADARAEYLANQSERAA
jgi:DNA-binding transcriptional regulator YdaS (Cro superfamily)